MFANGISNYSDTCSQLSRAIQDLDVRIRVSEQNQKLKDNYTEKIKKTEDNIALCNGVLDIMKPMLNDVQEYITEKRKESMQNINNAIRIAGDVIQDAEEGVYFKLDGDEAWLSTPDGLEVDMVEGCGFREVSSVFLRSVVLGSNHKLMDTLMLDEAFSLVSPENSATLSLYLNVLCQDKQVISIEQKSEVYSNVDATMYSFRKNGGYAEVTKSEVKRGSDYNAIQTD